MDPEGAYMLSHTWSSIPEGPTDSRPLTSDRGVTPHPRQLTKDEPRRPPSDTTEDGGS